MAPPEFVVQSCRVESIQLSARGSDDDCLVHDDVEMTKRLSSRKLHMVDFRSRVMPYLGIRFSPVQRTVGLFHPTGHLIDYSHGSTAGRHITRHFRKDLGGEILT